MEIDRIARGNDGSEAGTDAAVRAAQIDVLYRAPAFMLLNFPLALVIALFLWPYYSNWAIATWIAFIFTIGALRFRDRQRYLHASDTQPWQSGKRLVLGTIATGGAWGLGAAALLVAGHTQIHEVVFFLVAGLIATAVVADTAYMPAFIGFLVPAVLPIYAAILVRPTTAFAIMGLLLTALATVLAGVGHSINRRIVDNLRLQIVRSALAADLEAASRELSRRDAILRAMVTSATELLRRFDLHHSMPEVLRLAGESTNVSRVYLQQITQGRSGDLQRYVWTSPSCPAKDDLVFLPLGFDAAGLGDWARGLAQGKSQSALVHQLASPAREALGHRGAKSILVVPVFAQGEWWGLLGFDDCDNERSWSTVEVDTLKTIAELVGAAIGHARSLDELTGAARIIEHSSTILFRLQPTPPHAPTYISMNVQRYGYSFDLFLRQPDLYMKIVHPDDRPKVLEDLARIVANPAAEIVNEYRLRRSDGVYVWFECHTRALYDEARRLTAIDGILTDISERKAAQAAILAIERTDQLTGLISRKSFMEQLTHAFIAAKRGAPAFAVLYLDLDYFKDINDVYGHSKGDELLKAVAMRLREVHRAHDVIARFGGDEFAVLQTDVTDPSVAGTLATRILHALSSPYPLGTDIHVTASIGIAVYDSDVSGPEEIMQRADLALYRAKDAGRNQYHFHSDALDLVVRERVTLGEDLRLALERHEIEIYYQPQVKASSGSILGLEALARWNHPRLGLLLPGRFIPIAEKTGVIGSLGLGIIDAVCHHVARWRVEFPWLPPVSINLSAAQLRPGLDFDREFIAILRGHGLDPGAIELELTESVLMQATRENSQMIERLRRLGTSIAIDDFGTGYSSLEYLRAYRVSRIKIAQEFIHHLDTDPNDAAIVRATISLARELGIQVIAEGVETKAQLDVLVTAGCEVIQGHYFSRAIPAAETEIVLRRGRLDPADAATAATGARPADNAASGDEPARKRRGGT